MNKKLKLCLALFMALAVLVQYSFTPQALVAYGLNNTDNAVQTEEAAGDDGQAADEQKATEATEPTDATEAAKPAGEDKAPAADKQDVNYPAAQFSEKAGDVTVNIVAPEGALPEGTTVKVETVDTSEVEKAVEKLYEEATVVKAVDITFKNKDGKEIEPNEKVSVTFASKAFGKLDDAAVVHINDKGKAEEVEKAKVDADKKQASFKADEFSIYAVVSTGSDARVKVIFKNGNTEVGSMYVKSGDNMQQVLYDPGAGTVPEGAYFRGWTTVEDYTTETKALSISDVRTAVNGMLPPATDGTVVTYYAMLFKDYRITYLDEKGISLGQEEVTFRADAVNPQQSYTVNMAYTVQSDTEHFEGWKVNEGGSNIAGHTDGKIYPNNTEISITGDVTFGVNAPKGHWFIFDENGKGATYNAPQFVYSSDKPIRPNDNNMIRNGYTFGGWFEDKAVADQTSGGTQYNFNQTLTDKVTVYARWIPNETAQYTVIIWKQNIDGNGYDFVEAIHLNGNVDTTINTVTQQGTGDNAYARVNNVNKQYTGFHLKEFDRNVTINTEGNSVLNVYYDRNQHTLQFQVQDYIYTPTTDNGGTQYGLVDGQYVQLTRHNSGSWLNPQYYWTYGNNNRYSGTRYTRSFGWTTIKEITALYGQSIGDNFPIVGTNGRTYDQGERWKPQNSSTYKEVLVYIDIMPNESVTFRLDEASHTTKHIYYYVETLPGQDAERTYNGKDFVLHKSVAANYGFFTEAEDYLDFVGFTKYGYTPNNAWGSDGADNVYCYYTRNVYPINFMDGKYIDGEGNPLEESGMGQIGTKTNIAYGADVSSNNDYKPDAAHTPAGYVFEGWYIDSACTTPFTFNKMPEGGITVYAKWRQKQYRVFLHPNYPEGATGHIDWGTSNQQMCFRESEGGHVSEPTGRLAGFEFVGWYLDAACTEVFNGDAYTINETNVTTPYDKTVDMTDTYDVDGNLIDPKKNSDLTGYNGSDRFWITKKLDIYAKWRSTLEGASGIVVEYDADGGTGAPTDTHTYVDGAKAPAGAASKSTDAKKVFSHWAVQKWNGTEWVDTGDKVLPGKTFTVLAANAKVEDIVNPQPGGDTKKYTVRLKAVYIDSEEPTPTHIYWYKNDGSDAYVKKNNAAINVGVDIPVAPTREGYDFLGWSRVNIGTTQEAATAWENNPNNWTQELTEANLYLKYADGAYTISDGTTVTQVAPDEKTPYHAMFAVWKEKKVTINYAVHSDSTGMGTVDPTTETVKAASGTATGSTATPASDMYAFDYWTCEDGTEHVGDAAHFTPSKNSDGVYVAHTYYAHFKLNKAAVTVHHYLKGTTTKVAEDVTSNEVIGSEYTATPVTTYQSKDLTVDDYNPSQTVTVSANGNEITIYYTLPLTITAETKNKVYDGNALQGSYEISGELSSDTQTIKDALDTAPSITNVADSPKEYLTTSEQAAITGIPSYYVVTYTPGTLTITPRPVTFTGKSETKEYTGSEITINTVEVSSGTDVGLVDGHTHNVVFSASGTEAGTYPGTITAKDDVVIKDGDKVVTANYDITVANGTLTISKTTEALTVSLEEAEYVYDAQPHSLTAPATTNAKSGTTTIEYSKDGQTWTTDLSSLTATTVADSCTIRVRASNPNYNNTATGSAKLTIKKRPVTFTGQSGERAFTGQEIELTGITRSSGTDEGLVSGHTDNVTYSAKGTDVGEYNGTITAKDDVIIKVGNDDVTANYAITVVSGKLKIVQDEDLELTVSLESAEYVYDAQQHSLTKSATDNAASGTTTFEYSKDGQTWTTDLSSLTATTVADSCTINVKASNPNYKNTATGSATLTIKPRPVTFTGRSEEKEYTGSEITINTVDVTETAEGVGLVSGHTHTVAFSASGTEAGTHTGTITAKDDVVIKDGNNDNVTANYDITVVNGTLTITKTDEEFEITLDDDSYGYDGQPHSNAKTPTSSAKSGATSFQYSKDGQTWTEDLSSLTATEVKDSFTIQVKATNPNYNKPTTTTAKLTITPAEVQLTANSDTNKIYNGQTQTVTGYTSSVSGLTFPGVAASGSGENVGDYDVTFTGVTVNETTDSTGNYIVAEIVPGTLKIKPLAVVVTVVGHHNKDVEYYNTLLHEQNGYDATADSELYKTSGVSPDFSLKPGVSAHAETTDAGTIYMGLNDESFVNNNGNFTVTFNVTDGYVTVTPLPVTVTISGNSVTATYDGKAHSVEGYTAESNNTLYHVDDPGAMSFFGDDTAARTKAGTTKMDLSASDFSNSDGNFDVTFQIASDGKVTINPRSITLTSGSASKRYDGAPLTSHVVNVTSGSLVSGETLACTVTGTRTAVGSSKNTFEVTANGDVIASGVSAFASDPGNYEINKVFGTLTVTAAPTPTPTPAPGPGPGVGPAPAPAAPAQVVVDNPTPTTVIDEPAPKAVTDYWALINLLCAIATALLSLIMLIRFFGKRRYEEEVMDPATGQTVTRDVDEQRKGFARIASLIPAIGAIIAFIVTEDMSLPMAMVDKWTILMVVILAIQAGVGIFAKLRDNDEEEEDDEAMA